VRKKKKKWKFTCLLIPPNTERVRISEKDKVSQNLPATKV
jgi:hypothetical protein